MVVSQTPSQIKSLIDFFFENQSVEELKVKFKELHTISEEEYKNLFKNYDSSNGVFDNGIFKDEFTYDESFVNEDETVTRILARIYLAYTKDSEGNIYIYEVIMWREALS